MAVETCEPVEILMRNDEKKNEKKKYKITLKIPGGVDCQSSNVLVVLSLGG